MLRLGFSASPTVTPMSSVPVELYQSTAKMSCLLLVELTDVRKQSVDHHTPESKERCQAGVLYDVLLEGTHGTIRWLPKNRVERQHLALPAFGEAYQ